MQRLKCSIILDWTESCVHSLSCLFILNPSFEVYLLSSKSDCSDCVSCSRRAQGPENTRSTTDSFCASIIRWCRPVSTWNVPH